MMMFGHISGDKVIDLPKLRRDDGNLEIRACHQFISASPVASYSLIGCANSPLQLDLRTAERRTTKRLLPFLYHTCQ
jgi:hypothetical protein